MTRLRPLLILLAIMIAPLQPVTAGAMLAGSGGAATTTMQAAMPMQAPMAAECCQDGSHQTAACNLLPALPETQTLNTPALPRREGHPNPAARLARGQAPPVDLRPPILI